MSAPPVIIDKHRDNADPHVAELTTELLDLQFIDPSLISRETSERFRSSWVPARSRRALAHWRENPAALWDRSATRREHPDRFGLSQFVCPACCRVVTRSNTAASRQAPCPPRDRTRRAPRADREATCRRRRELPSSRIRTPP